MNPRYTKIFIGFDSFYLILWIKAIGARTK